jgi:anti-sigma B factor antagonist
VAVENAFVVRSEWTDRTMVLELSGELDLLSTREFEVVLASAMHSGAEQVILDVAGLDFIDARGLGAIFQARAGSDGGIRLRVRAARGQVARMLRLSGIGELLAPS